MVCVSPFNSREKETEDLCSSLASQLSQIDELQGQSSCLWKITRKIPITCLHLHMHAHPHTFRYGNAIYLINTCTYKTPHTHTKTGPCSSWEKKSEEYETHLRQAIRILCVGRMHWCAGNYLSRNKSPCVMSTPISIMCTPMEVLVLNNKILETRWSKFWIAYCCLSSIWALVVWDAAPWIEMSWYINQEC